MARKTLIADEFPSFGSLFHGQEHFKNVAEIILRLVEYAVSQACAYKNTQETVHKERLEQLHIHLLTLVKMLHYKISRRQAYNPTERIVAYLKPENRKKTHRRVPNNIAG